MPRGKLRWADIYQWGGILHRDVGAMSLWELRQAMRGYQAANGVKPRGPGIGEDRLAAMGVEGFN